MVTLSGALELRNKATMAASEVTLFAIARVLAHACCNFSSGDCIMRRAASLYSCVALGVVAGREAG